MSFWGVIFMGKVELFRQIGWSKELIEHFVITDDIEDCGRDDFEEPAGFVETTTAVISYQTPSNRENVNISVP